MVRMLKAGLIFVGLGLFGFLAACAGIVRAE